MSMPRRFVTRLAGLALAAGPTPPAAAGRADDTALFAAVPPNVLLVIDNSGSMNESSCTRPTTPPATELQLWDDDVTYLRLESCGQRHGPRSTIDTNGFNDRATTPSSGYLRQASPRNIFSGPGCPRGRQLHALGRQVPQLVLQHGKCLLTSRRSSSTTNGTVSSCLGGGTFSQYRRARVTAAKDVLREVVCNVNQRRGPLRHRGVPPSRGRHGATRTAATCGCPSTTRRDAPAERYR